MNHRDNWRLYLGVFLLSYGASLMLGIVINSIKKEQS